MIDKQFEEFRDRMLRLRRGAASLGEPMFMELPESWCEAGLWRCQNGHVRSKYLKTDRGSVCLAGGCGKPVMLTAPFDSEAPESDSGSSPLNMYADETGWFVDEVLSSPTVDLSDDLDDLDVDPRRKLDSVGELELPAPENTKRCEYRLGIVLNCSLAGQVMKKFNTKNDVKIAADISFPESIRTASLDELIEFRKNHSHKNAPSWKKIAIERRIHALGGEPLTVTVPTTGHVWSALR